MSVSSGDPVSDEPKSLRVHDLELHGLVQGMERRVTLLENDFRSHMTFLRMAFVTLLVAIIGGFTSVIVALEGGI